jgi:hypothetical protein
MSESAAGGVLRDVARVLFAVLASAVAVGLGASVAPGQLASAGAVALGIVALGAGVWAALTGVQRAPVALVLAAAALVRAPWLLAPPTFSDDVYRYVWEGRVWAAGFNPFSFAPSDPALVGLRDAVWARVNHPEVSSIYPPLAQAGFVLLAPFGVLGWKVAAAAFDCGTAALLARRRPEAGWLWALLPLAALESAGSGHLEAIGVFLLVASLDAAGRGRDGAARTAAWAGAMVKLLPAAALLPLLRNRRDWMLWTGVSVIAALPLLGAGAGAVRGFETYRATWMFNGSAYPLLAWSLSGLPGDPARSILQGVGAVVVGGALWRAWRDPGWVSDSRDAGLRATRVALAATGAFVLLSPTVHPWYVLWALAVALWTGAQTARPWVLAAVLVPGAYRVLSTLHDGVWSEDPMTRWAIWLPVWLVLGFGWLRPSRSQAP